MKKFYVKVTFEKNGKPYAYLSYDETLKVDDDVLVVANNRLITANIIEIKDIESLNYNDQKILEEYDLKFILSRVDFSKYEKGIEYEKRKKELEEQLKEHYEKMSVIAKYEILANNDETMKKLLEEYKNL